MLCFGEAGFSSRTLLMGCCDMDCDVLDRGPATRLPGGVVESLAAHPPITFLVAIQKTPVENFNGEA